MQFLSRSFFVFSDISADIYIFNIYFSNNKTKVGARKGVVVYNLTSVRHPVRSVAESNPTIGRAMRSIGIPSPWRMDDDGGRGRRTGAPKAWVVDNLIFYRRNHISFEGEGVPLPQISDFDNRTGGETPPYKNELRWFVYQMAAKIFFSSSFCAKIPHIYRTL